MAKNYSNLAADIIKAIGGKENVIDCFHCFTRLRFVLKDIDLVDEEALKKLVMGTQLVGDQLQLIVGQDVADLYKVVCSTGGFEVKAAIDEKVDADTDKSFNVKDILPKVFNYFSRTMMAILPCFMGAGMAKTIAVVIGPEMLKLVAAESDVILILNMIYETVMSFLPVYAGYSAARTINLDQIYGLFTGLLVFAPSLVSLVGVRESISVFGIPAAVANYGGSILPAIIGVPVCKLIWSCAKKYMPKVVEAITVPLITFVLMIPVMLCAVCPLSTWISNLMAGLFSALAASNPVVRIIGSTLLCTLFPLLVLSGTHIAVMTVGGYSWYMNGSESFILPASQVFSWAVYGLALGAFIKFTVKKSENKTSAMSCFITGVVGGVSEPTIFGIASTYKRGMLALMGGCAIGGIVSGILRPTVYMLAALTNIFTAITPWLAGGSGNTVVGILVCVVSFVASAVLAFILIDEEK
ncbi:MAG: PTS transporter subunit EIIB [Erysipelotrichaceae bacterium]|nr:PTS transporter subunit EIIB [Erysipelotrichaceae bacterium]